MWNCCQLKLYQIQQRDIVIYHNKIDFNSYKENFSCPVAIYGTDESCIYSNLSVPFEAVELAGLEDSYVKYQISRTAAESFILVGGIVSQNGTEVYLVTECDISELVNNQNSMISYFQKIYSFFYLDLVNPLF